MDMSRLKQLAGISSSGQSIGGAKASSMKATGLLKEEENLTLSLEVGSALKASHVAISLADNQIDAFLTKGIGDDKTYYFNFKTDADLKKGTEIADKIFDPAAKAVAAHVAQVAPDHSASHPNPAFGAPAGAGTPPHPGA